MSKDESNFRKCMDYQYSDFELEFCLSRSVYCEIYNENGTLWNNRHQKQVDMFHEMFKMNEGKDLIFEELKVLFMSYFNDKNTFLNSFSIEEFTKDEIEYLKIAIDDLKTFEK